MMDLLGMIERSEEQIRTGRFTKADTSMSDEEIDDLLTRRTEISLKNKKRDMFNKEC